LNILDDRKRSSVTSGLTAKYGYNPLEHYKLNAGPLYGLGYQRTACWSCPLVNPGHPHQSKRPYPGLWAEIDERAVRGFEAAPEMPPNAAPF
jgi:hypothetical protein